MVLCTYIYKALGITEKCLESVSGVPCFMLFSFRVASDLSLPYLVTNSLQSINKCQLIDLLFPRIFFNCIRQPNTKPFKTQKECTSNYGVQHLTLAVEILQSRALALLKLYVRTVCLLAFFQNAQVSAGGFSEC